MSARQPACAFGGCDECSTECPLCDVCHCCHDHHPLKVVQAGPRGTWLDHADDCPRGSECNCDHPALVVGKAMEWGNE